MAVGKSPRTPMKHDLLWSLVGREVGVVGTGKFGRCYQLVDLCAGEGSASSWPVTRQNAESSTSIFFHHAKYLLDKRVAPHVVAVERHDTTFRALKKNVALYSGSVSHRLFNCDAKNIDLNELWEKQPDVAFILNDPNTVVDFALTREVLCGAPRLTTTLSTLGCNPRGIKRLKLSQDEGHDRLEWFDHVNVVLSFLPRRHDAMIVRLNRDAALWAYLVTGPTTWFDQDKYQDNVSRAFRSWEHGVSMARCRTQRHSFDAIVHELFLTKNELARFRHEQKQT